MARAGCHRLFFTAKELGLDNNGSPDVDPVCKAPVCESAILRYRSQLIDHYVYKHPDIVKFRYEAVLFTRGEVWPMQGPSRRGGVSNFAVRGCHGV